MRPYRDELKQQMQKLKITPKGKVILYKFNKQQKILEIKYFLCVDLKEKSLQDAEWSTYWPKEYQEKKIKKRNLYLLSLQDLNQMENMRPVSFSNNADYLRKISQMTMKYKTISMENSDLLFKVSLKDCSIKQEEPKINITNKEKVMFGLFCFLGALAIFIWKDEMKDYVHSKKEKEEV